MERPVDALTSREQEVLALMAEGLTNAAIAERLDISFATAKTHVSDILGRLGVDSREEAVAVCQRNRGASSTRSLAWIAMGLARVSAGVGAAGVLVVGIFGVVAALRAQDEEPVPDELRVPLADLAIEIPEQVSVPQLGKDPVGRDYPLWLVRHADGTVDALIGRDPHTGCIVPYERDYSAALNEGFDQVRQQPGGAGAFKGYCGGWVFLRNGEVVFGAASRGLDKFPVRVEGEEVVVRLDAFMLGTCRTGETSFPCSPAGAPVLVDSLPDAQVELKTSNTPGPPPTP